MPPDVHRGTPDGDAPDDYAGLRIDTIRPWLWWLRFLAFLAVLGAMTWADVQDVSPLILLGLGFVLGIVFDRMILWPLAVLVARLDGRIRSR